MRKVVWMICLLLCAALFALPQLAFADNAPTVTITFDKDTVEVGETVTAIYRIIGEDTYTEVYWDWYAETDDEMGHNIGYGSSGDLEGTISVVPKFGEELYLCLHVEDENGRGYYFESERTKISGFADGYDVYDIIEGQNTQITDGSAPLTFRADGDYGKYLGVQVNGSWVPERYVTAWEGSTYIKLSEDYLGTLDDGEHELIVVFNDGIARTQFYVDAVVDMPQTGDSSVLSLWIALLVLACAGSSRRRKMV